MPKIEQKQKIVQEIKEKLNKSVSIVLIDARGVTVEEDTTLRKKFRDANVDYKVYKNSLLEFAVKDTPYESLALHLKGPTAVAFSYGDATSAASIISKESNTVKALEFKAGIIESILYDSKGMEAIANIPSKEELLSKLFGSFKSPMSTFARVISQIAQQQGGQEDNA